jgi:hypothetical protein
MLPQKALSIRSGPLARVSRPIPIGNAPKQARRHENGAGGACCHACSHSERQGRGVRIIEGDCHASGVWRVRREQFHQRNDVCLLSHHPELIFEAIHR